MVECKGNAHELSLCDVAFCIHYQLILHCADTQNACIRLIDDRIKGFYAEHTQIGDGEGRALIFVHRQLICSCTFCQISRCFGNFAQTHLIRVLDNGHNQTILQCNRHTDIHMRTLDNPVTVDRYQNMLVIFQCLCRCFQHIIIQRIFHAKVIVNLLTECHQLCHINADILRNGRDFLCGFCHSFGNDLSHPCQLDNLVAIHQFQCGFLRRCLFCCRLCYGCRCGFCSFCRRQNILLHDSAQRAGACHCCIIYPQLCCCFLCQRGNSDSAACHRCRRCCCGHGCRRFSRRCFCLCRGCIPNLFACFADICQQTLYGDILAFLRYNL